MALSRLLAMPSSLSPASSPDFLAELPRRELRPARGSGTAAPPPLRETLRRDPRSSQRPASAADGEFTLQRLYQPYRGARSNQNAYFQPFIPVHNAVVCPVMCCELRQG